jgi:hypothetical protein
MYVRCFLCFLWSRNESDGTGTDPWGQTLKNGDHRVWAIRRLTEVSIVLLLMLVLRIVVMAFG